MNGHCINIAISGISLKVSDELKIELRKTIPNDFGINWINIADPNIDLLLINENFFDTEGIQRILKEKKLGEFKHEVRQFEKSYDNQQAEQISLMVGEFKHEVRQFEKSYDNQQAEQISLMV